ncbi:hypothetical protein MTP99_013600 [Tenebrio molitor]|nr:hypothetical protein MTP99_013600 [Tenebrio molitor]CAH1372099.1 unnamed protein product [Tenebrio molitor]
MSEIRTIHASSCGDFSDEQDEAKNEVFATKSCDLAKLRFMPKSSIEKTLTDWRSEQLQKIEEELQLLHVIEKMMKQSDSVNFEGFTDEKKFADLIRNAKNKSSSLFLNVPCSSGK